jgi:hypothetical protein
VPAVVFDPPRDLTPEERTILDFLIEANVEQRDTLAALLRDSQVTSLCGCGCESPTLTIDQEAALDAAPVPLKLPEDAAARVEGKSITVMLFVNLERPAASMEYVWHTSEQKNRGPRLPRADELEIARWEPVPGREGRSRYLANFADDEEEA